MESNGKSIGRDGHQIIKQELLFGESQGLMHNTLFSINTPRNKIDADFIGFVKPLHGDNEQHDKLMSNFLLRSLTSRKISRKKYK
jgi:glucose-6-phosphate isomerase